MLMTSKKEYYSKENRYKRRARKQKINSIIGAVGVILFMLLLCINWEMTLGL